MSTSDTQHFDQLPRARIADLERELAQAKAELKWLTENDDVANLRAEVVRLTAWYNALSSKLGSTQLSHVVARVEQLEKAEAEAARLNDFAFDKDGTPWKTVCGWWSTKYNAAERQMRDNLARATDAEAEVARLLKIEFAAKELIDYQASGAPDFPEWEEKFDTLKAALAGEGKTTT